MALTKMDAVNLCLTGVGIASVDDITSPDLDTDTLEAISTVNRVASELQERGWWFNRESNWKLTPNITTGVILTPASVLSCVTSGQSRGYTLTIRGVGIYDPINHTTDLTELVGGDGTIEFTFVMDLDFEDLPPIARTAIAYTARRLFAQDLEMDNTRWGFQSKDEQMAMIALLRADTKNMKRNQITNNYAIQNFMANVGGANAVTSQIGVYPRRLTQ